MMGINFCFFYYHIISVKKNTAIYGHKCAPLKRKFSIRNSGDTKTMQTIQKFTHHLSNHTHGATTSTVLDK